MFNGIWEIVAWATIFALVFFAIDEIIKWLKGRIRRMLKYRNRQT